MKKPMKRLHSNLIILGLLIFYLLMSWNDIYWLRMSLIYWGLLLILTLNAWYSQNDKLRIKIEKGSAE